MGRKRDKAMNEISILVVLSFIIFGSPYVSKFLRIPISPTEIMLGIVAAGFGLLPENEFFKHVADIGFYYLMFLAGTEVDLKIFITTDKKTLKRSILFLLLLYIFATLFTFVFDLGKIFIVVITLMSVGLLSTLYKDYGKNEEWLNLAMLVGVIGEVISIALLTVAGAYLKSGFSIDLFKDIFALGGFLLFSTMLFKGLEVLFWWYPNIKSVLMPQYDKDEKDIRLAIALLCLVVAMMIILELEIVIGAFIAGTFIPTFFDHKKDLPHKLSSFGFGFIIPIFFAYIGSTVDINALFIPGVLPVVSELVACMILFRVFSAFVFLKKLKFEKMLLFALSLSMPLTLVIATATIGYSSGNITKKLYYAFILASLFEAIICMILIRFINSFKFSENKMLK